MIACKCNPHIRQKWLCKVYIFFLQSTSRDIKTKGIVSATFPSSNCSKKLIFGHIIFSSLLQRRLRLHWTNLCHLKPIISNTRSTAFILKDLVLSFHVFSPLLHYEKAAWGMRTCCWGHPFVMLSVYNIENPPVLFDQRNSMMKSHHRWWTACVL